MADFSVSMVLRAVDRASGPLRRVGSALGGISTRARAARKDAASAFRLGADIRQTATAVDAFAQKSRAALQAPTQEFEKFEHEMARTRGLTGATDAEFGKLLGTAKELGSTIGEFSAYDAATAMSEFGMAGYDTNQILAVMPRTLDLSTASTVGLSDTVSIATGIMGGFGLKAEDMGRVADVLTATFTGSKTSLQSLGETMAYSGAVARAAGVSLEETATIAGLLGNASIDASRAGTALNAILTRLAAPRRLARKGLAFLGIDPTEMRDGERQLKKPLAILGEIQAKMNAKNLGPAKSLGLLSVIFGQEAGPAVATLMGALGSDTIEKFSARVVHSEGAVKTLADTMRRTGRNATLELNSAVNGLQLALGEALNPTLNAGKRLLRDIAVSLTNFATKHPTAAKAIMITVAAVAVLTTALAGLLFTIATLIGALGFGAMVFGVKATGAELVAMAAKAIPRAIAGLARLAWTVMAQVVPAFGRFAVAVLANPIGLIVLAIIAAVAAVVWMVRNWDKLTAAWERFKNASLATKIVLGVLLAPIVALASPLLLIAYLSKKVIDNWEPIKSTFIGVWESVVGWIEKAVQAVKDFGNAAAGNPVVSGLLKAGKLIVNPFAAIDAIDDVSGGAFSGQINAAAGIAGRLGAGAADVARESAGVLGIRGSAPVSGTVRVQIDTPPNVIARVRDLDATGPLDLEANTGQAMVWAY